MPLPSAIVIVLAALVAGLDWIAIARGNTRLERRAKPAVIVLLILAAVLADPDASPRSLLLATALGASLTGDVLLLPPGRFVTGLTAFLIAHLAYAALFVLIGIEGGLSGVNVGFAAIGVVGAVAAATLAGRPILAGAARAEMLRPVRAYLGAILLMAVAATATGSLISAAGAWLFVTSDALLGWDRFVAVAPATPAAGRLRHLVVTVTYHAAQVLLVVAVLGVPRP